MKIMHILIGIFSISVLTIATACEVIEVSCVETASTRCPRRDKPPDAWVRRINNDRAQRLSALKAANNDVSYDVVVDFFKMGERNNYFISVGVLGDRIDIAASCDGRITVTNLSITSTSKLVGYIKRELPSYKYRRHSGTSPTYVQVSIASNDGFEISKWFDGPTWDAEEDSWILGTLMFSGKTKDDEVWRSFLRLFRIITPGVSEYVHRIDLTK